MDFALRGRCTGAAHDNPRLLPNETALTLPTFVLGSCYGAAWHHRPATRQQTLSQAVPNASFLLLVTSSHTRAVVGP